MGGIAGAVKWNICMYVLLISCIFIFAVHIFNILSLLFLSSAFFGLFIISPLLMNIFQFWSIFLICKIRFLSDSFQIPFRFLNTSNITTFISLGSFRRLVIKKSSNQWIILFLKLIINHWFDKFFLVECNKII